MIRQFVNNLFRKNTVSQKRAMEILALGSKNENWDEVATPDEVNIISKKWETMPDDACWLDALKSMAKGDS
jgi:hypothetical protein